MLQCNLRTLSSVEPICLFQARTVKRADVVSMLRLLPMWNMHKS